MIFDEDILAEADELRELYEEASPFPHIVLDGIVKPRIAEQISEEFPEPQAGWTHFRNDVEGKYACNQPSLMGDTLAQALAAFNSKRFLGFLEELTGIGGLMADKRLMGGGLHYIPPGGKLGIHVDFNKMNGLDRRLNVLWYVNPDWQEEWGGHLELWSNAKEPVKKYLPGYNRLVVFNTTETSWHGHPHPLSCPANRARRSLALYYYTVGRPEHEQAESHSTVFI